MSSQSPLDFACRAGGLTIRLQNSDILRDMEPTIRLIAQLIETQRPTATLIDFRGVPVPATFLERFELGEMAGRHLAGRVIAVLLRPDQADRQEIGKVVAVNRGALVEVFTETAAAEAWLRQRAEPEKPA